MAVQITITCGCGFKVETAPKKQAVNVLAEAIDHSQKTGHTLTVNGLVKGVKK